MRWKKGRSTEAQRKLDEALKFYPGFPEALTFYGFIHATFQHWESAEQKLQAAIQTDPTYSPAYVVLAGVYNAQKRFDEAQQAVQLGRSAGADTWHVPYEIARSLIGRGDYEGALATAEAALRSKA
jgi:tetratricopeptide (TPR) repeat protein